MSSRELQRVAGTELAVETTVFASYLHRFGLPTDNIIATTDERRVIATNLPTFLDALPPEEKREARYLSKFVGATAIGLFDAALNYVWNEVVLNLRKKVVIYGLDLFYDAAVGGKNRDAYKDESDLGGLKDSVLLDTCLKLELISEVVYRKLDHILTMRNEVAASHPNVESIGGFELLGWLQTCVKDVLQDRPSESAIRIRSLIDNIKSRTDVVDDATLNRVTAELRNLSLPHVHNLLLTLFGIFVSPETHQILRKNIARLAPALWSHSEDRVKYKIGAIIDGYRTNLSNDRLTAGQEFLQLVDGRRFEALPARVVAIENLCDQLEDAHQGWDNFYNEPPFAVEILSYCKTSVDVPKAIVATLVRVVLKCRLGRGLSYRQGVSPAGIPLYDRILSLLDDEGISHAIAALYLPDVNAKLSNTICQGHLAAILEILKRIAISERLKAAIEFLLKDIPNAGRANAMAEFRELTGPFIAWR